MFGLVTPRKLSQRAELYYQLSQMLDSGIGIVHALEMQRRSLSARALRDPIDRWLRPLNDGASFSDALDTTPRWLPAFDRALLRAGETSGRLPACLRLLGDFYRQSAAMLKRSLADLTYPLFLFHFAVLIGPSPNLFLSGDFLAYLGATLSILLPSYAIGLGIIYALQGQRGENWRAVVETITAGIPFFGRARRHLALSRLAAALEALLSAGVSIFEAWPLAAAGSGSPALDRAVRRWRPLLEAGRTPGELVGQTSCFPEAFASTYQTGEVSGRLEEALQRLHEMYRDEGMRQMRLLSEWVPRVIYLAIMAMIVYRVLSFYLGYFSQIERLIP